METIIFTEQEEVTFEFDLEAEIGQDEIEARSADEIETEERECCYSPNRFCEVILYPHVWDEMQFIFDEWADNVEAA